MGALILALGTLNYADDGVWQELRAQKAAENRRRTEMVRKQREDARAKKEAEQRQREAKQQEEHRRRIAAEKKKVLLCGCVHHGTRSQHSHLLRMREFGYDLAMSFGTS